MNSVRWAPLASSSPEKVTYLSYSLEQEKETSIQHSHDDPDDIPDFPQMSLDSGVSVSPIQTVMILTREDITPHAETSVTAAIVLDSFDKFQKGLDILRSSEFKNTEALKYIARSIRLEQTLVSASVPTKNISYSWKCYQKSAEKKTLMPYI